MCSTWVPAVDCITRMRHAFVALSLKLTKLGLSSNNLTSSGKDVGPFGALVDAAIECQTLRMLDLQLTYLQQKSKDLVTQSLPANRVKL